MGSLTDNPYKKFKKAFKGKPTGQEIHDFMKKKASPVKKMKAPEPAKQELGLALKKKGKKRKGKTTDMMHGDVEHKRKGDKPTINSGKEGDIEKKSKKGKKISKKKAMETC